MQGEHGAAATRLPTYADVARAPERIGDLIAGKIGQLQAGAIATAPAAATPARPRGRFSVAGTTVSLDAILQAIQAAETINLGAALSAVKSGDAGKILGVVEQVTDILADLGVPYANDAKIAEVILGFIIKGYETGLIRSASARRSGHAACGRQAGRHAADARRGRHSAPGGTPSDPYAFDRR